jgi:phosphomannomutase
VLDEQEWVLILPSPDEPYINIIAEASSQTNADKLVQTYAKLVKDLQP